ncbi:MAG: proline dehydrogenase family protein, partial [Chitinophagaceae bacterium]
MNAEQILSFDHTENAFEYKSDRQLKKSHFLFASMAYSWLVKIGTRLTPWAMRAGLPITGLIRNTIFEQFVGGETLEETKKVVDHLAKYHVQIILDYGVEGGDYGEAEKDHARDMFMRVIKYAATQPNIPFISIKVTGLVRFALLEALHLGMAKQSGQLLQRYEAAYTNLNENTQEEWQHVVDRMHMICNLAKEKGVGVLVDAEESWIQDPVDALTMLMMAKYNTDKAVVYNTVQLYRHDRLAFLTQSHPFAVEQQIFLGVKLVRGAYMEKERARAAAQGYASPIQPDKAATDKDFNEAVRFCLTNLDRVAVIIASHNEYSNLSAAAIMDEQGIAHHHPHVHFSQLYGMSDHITFNLAKSAFSVSKYLPFGPIKDVIPYLMRRAQENSSV